MGLMSLVGVMAAVLASAPVKADRGSFAAISDYTMSEQNLPDGKHPVWVYYLSDGPRMTIVRIEMPTMDMCVVTPRSKRDMDISQPEASHHLIKGSPEWKLAEDIWDNAFQRHLIVGEPQRC